MQPRVAVFNLITTHLLNELELANKYLEQDLQFIEMENSDNPHLKKLASAHKRSAKYHSVYEHYQYVNKYFLDYLQQVNQIYFEFYNKDYLNNIAKLFVAAAKYFYFQMKIVDYTDFTKAGKQFHLSYYQQLYRLAVEPLCDIFELLRKRAESNEELQAILELNAEFFKLRLIAKNILDFTYEVANSTVDNLPAVHEQKAEGDESKAMEIGEPAPNENYRKFHKLMNRTFKRNERVQPVVNKFMSQFPKEQQYDLSANFLEWLDADPEYDYSYLTSPLSTFRENLRKERKKSTAQIHQSLSITPQLTSVKVEEQPTTSHSNMAVDCLMTAVEMDTRKDSPAPHKTR